MVLLRLSKNVFICSLTNELFLESNDKKRIDKIKTREPEPYFYEIDIEKYITKKYEIEHIYYNL